MKIMYFIDNKEIVYFTMFLKELRHKKYVSNNMIKQ